MRLHRTVLRIGIFLVLAAMTACATSSPARKPKPHGFLEDYDRLHKGHKGQAELVYVAPDVNWSQYDSILLDPVLIWRGTEDRSHGLSHKQAQDLANYFHQLLYKQLSQHWTMATEPGPSTLRVATAITKLNEEHVVLDVISTFVPQVRGPNTLQSLASGKLLFTGEAAIEARMTDSETGQIIAEGIDERVGKFVLSGEQLHKWGDVQNILEFWTQRSIHNLCTIQEREGCPPLP